MTSCLKEQSTLGAVGPPALSEMNIWDSALPSTDSVSQCSAEKAVPTKRDLQCVTCLNAKSP